MPVLTVFSPLASLKINKNILVLVLRISLSLYTKTCSYFPWLTFVILELFSLQLSSITQSYPILCDPIDCSMPGFPVHHQLPELAQTHVHRVSDPSNHLIHIVPFSSCLQASPASWSFQMSQFLTSGGQSIGVSTSASVLPMNIQDWFPLGWTGWISLQSSISSSVLSFLYCPTLTSIMEKP